MPVFFVGLAWAVLLGTAWGGMEEKEGVNPGMTSWLVRFEPGTSEEEVAQVLLGAGVKDYTWVTRRLGFVIRFEVRGDEGGRAIVEQLRLSRGVVAVEAETLRKSGLSGNEQQGNDGG